MAIVPGGDEFVQESPDFLYPAVATAGVLRRGPQVCARPLQALII